jgi:hypothetical protein
MILAAKGKDKEAENSSNRVSKKKKFLSPFLSIFQQI